MQYAQENHHPLTTEPASRSSSIKRHFDIQKNSRRIIYETASTVADMHQTQNSHMTQMTSGLNQHLTDSSVRSTTSTAPLCFLEIAANVSFCSLFDIFRLRMYLWLH